MRFILLGASICDAYTHGRRGYGVYKYVYLNLRTEYIYFSEKEGGEVEKSKNFADLASYLEAPSALTPPSPKLASPTKEGSATGAHNVQPTDRRLRPRTARSGADAFALPLSLPSSYRGRS